MKDATKSLLGTLSPLYGMTSGHGLFGKDVGLLPAMAKRMRDEEEEKAGKMPTSAMKKGGKVSSASSRADGCAQRGKTRGKMV
jgi:hypothetical protein